MRSSILNILGTLLFAFNQWVQIILITRVIGVYEVGLYAYFLALVGPLVLLSRFSFSTLIPTQRKYNYSYETFLKFRNIFNYIFLLIIAIIIFTLDLKNYEVICLIIFTLFKFYETKEEFIYTQNISESNIKFLAISKIYKSIMTIILVLITILIFKSFLLMIISLLISQIAIYYFYDRRHMVIDTKLLKAIPNFKIKNIFILGLGLTSVEILTSLNANIPRYLIKHFHSIEDLGVYSTIMYFAVITNNIIIAINQSVIAKLVRSFSENINIFFKSCKKLLLIYTFLISIMITILFLFGNDILVLIYGNQFKGYHLEVILIGIHIGLMTYYKVFEMILSIMNFYKIQVLFQIFTFILTIVLTILLVIPYGITGGFLVTILAFFFGVVGQIISVVYFKRNYFKY